MEATPCPMATPPRVLEQLWQQDLSEVLELPGLLEVVQVEAQCELPCPLAPPPPVGVV